MYETKFYAFGIRARPLVERDRLSKVGSRAPPRFNSVSIYVYVTSQPPFLFNKVLHFLSIDTGTQPEARFYES